MSDWKAVRASGPLLLWQGFPVRASGEFGPFAPFRDTNGATYWRARGEATVLRSEPYFDSYAGAHILAGGWAVPVRFRHEDILWDDDNNQVGSRYILEAVAGMPPLWRHGVVTDAVRRCVALQGRLMAGDDPSDAEREGAWTSLTRAEYEGYLSAVAEPFRIPEVKP